MSYKTILVCPDNKSNTHYLTTIACDLASRSGDARVIATHWITRVHEYKHGERVTGHLTNDFDLPIAQLVRDMSSEFYRITADKCFPCEWVSINAKSERHTDVVVEYARCCDLVITSASSQNSISTGLTKELVLSSGRPVLVVPDIAITKPLKFGKAVIAWNASFQSSRAVFEALPLLKQMDEVEILWIEEPGNSDDVVHYLIKEFSAALAYHKINVIVEKIKPSTEEANLVDQLIAQRVSKVSADLLVAGAFGSTGDRPGELGTVSTRLLSSSPVPVLYSS